MLLLTLLGCAAMQPDPAVHSVHELALARPDPHAAHADEFDAFEAIRRAYVGLGWPEAAEVNLTLTADAVIPFADDGDVFVPPYRSAAHRDPHLRTVSRLFYGGRLDDYESRFPSPAQAADAYEAFLFVAMVHEMAHAVAYRRGISRASDNPYYEEVRAIFAELVVTMHMAAQGQVDPGLLADYDAFNRVLLAAAPKDLAFPETPVELAVLFNEHYGDMVGGIDEALRTGTHPAPASVDLVLATYSAHRVTWLQEPPTMDDLLAEMQQTLRGGLLEAVQEVAEVTEDDDTLVFTLGDVAWRVRVSIGDDVYYEGQLAPAVPVERRAAVLELLNELNTAQRIGRFQITTDDQVELYHFARQPKGYHARWMLGEAQERLEEALPRLEAVLAPATEEETP